MKHENILEVLPKIPDIAKENFGDDVAFRKIPFGIRFMDKVKETLDKLTATASGTITFGGLDTDADIDG